MKKLLLTLLLSASLLAEPPILKIAVVEGQQLLKQTKEGMRIEAQITKKREDLAEEIRALDQKLEKEANDMRAKQRTASDDVLAQKQESFMKAQRARENRAQEAEAEFKNFANRKLASFDKKLRKQIIEWAEKNQFDLVSLKESGEVIYTSQKANYTNQVMDILDTEFDKEAKILAAKEATKKIN